MISSSMLTSCTLPSVTRINLGMLPRRSSSVCSLTAALRRRNRAQGNSVRQRSMVVESRAYRLCSRSTPMGEWEAAAGYDNIDSAQIAFSDKPYSWNKTTGWPFKDANGNPVFKSNQDSYCVYNDSGNTKQILGIQINQTGYAYGIKLAQNMIFFKFDVINKSNNSYKGMYFDLYMDEDVGDADGGAPEYDDDLVGIDTSRNLAYMYDSKGYSLDWNTKTGYMGTAFLKTPQVNGKELGMTDCHYLIYDYDVDIDTIQYDYMSGSRALYRSE